MIADKLRQAILQAAIQGKLTKQLKSDGDAKDLLTKVQAEKAKLIREGKIKKEKPLPDITEDEKPFEIPENWEWVRLNNICEYIQRGKSPVYSTIKKYPVVAQKCNQWSGFSLELAQFADPNTIKSYSPERMLQQDDLLWNSTGLGTVGRMAIYDSKKNPYELAVADSHVTVIRLFKQHVLAQYVYAYISGPSVQSIIELQTTGSTKQKELQTETVKKYLIPLPPLAEQKRIVARIESLLPELDKLEKEETRLETMQQAFPKAMKDSLLQAAIQGKLTKQLESDGDAKDLLAKIQFEKAKLIEEGKIKKEKSLPEITIEEIPFEIPKNWCWCHFIDCMDIRDGTHDTPKYVINGIPLITSKNLNNGKLDFSTVKFISNDDADKINLRSFVDDGDILFAMIGSIGNPVLVKKEREFCIKNVALFKNVKHIMNMQYINFYLQFAQSVMKRISSGAVQSFISLKVFREFLLPLPPLAEQKRIVERLNELLPLCDKL
jgi:type I restriction enzyme S subunit